MGTNYYWVSPEKNHCSACGRADPSDRIHIGKSSGGWVFALHVTKDIKSLDDWITKWNEPHSRIEDEYGEVISKEKMFDIITVREGREFKEFPRDSQFYISEEDFYEKNNACHGPNNLARAKIDGVYCIGHGEGTWDYLQCNFG